jgi:multidrug resistance efflux pump
MKYLLSICLLALSLNASIYYAKVEPYESFSIKASVSGEVISLYKEAEGKLSNGGVLLQIDDFLNKKELTSSKTKLISLKRTMELTLKNIKNSKDVERIREENYKKIKNLKTKSRTIKWTSSNHYFALNSIFSNSEKRFGAGMIISVLYDEIF